VSRGPQTFRQRDLAAALRACAAGGREVARVEISKDGKIVVVQSQSPSPSIPPVTTEREQCDRPAHHPPQLLSKENEATVCEQLGPAVYFLAAPPLLAIKIGFIHARSMLRGRIAELQTGCPYKLRPILATEGSFDLERDTHRAFAAERQLGEWFQFSGRIEHFVEMLRGGVDIRRALRNLAEMPRG
jgi:hypothetical protein